MLWEQIKPLDIVNYAILILRDKKITFTHILQNGLAKSRIRAFLI